MAYSIEQRDEQLLGTSASIRYVISFPIAAQHLLHVRMEVDTNAAEIILNMPNWIPGSYKVRDFIAFQGDWRVTDGEGAILEYEWIAKNRCRVITGGNTTIHAHYSYFSNERSVRQTHVNRFHAFINPVNCLMYVEGRMNEIHHVALEHAWEHTTTSLSPVQENVWGALNYDILADSPLEIGNHYLGKFDVKGIPHEVAITGNGDFDPDWITAQTKLIVDTERKMWGGLPYDRYVFIIQLLPGMYGGLEHARSSVNMFDSEAFADKEKVVKFLTLLCHEFFHLWNVKRIRPAELGPFDYDTENYTRMLWLAEGVTSYFDDLISYRCGFHTEEDYLKILSNDHLGRLLDTPGRNVMSISDSSYLSWVKLYIPTVDSANRFPSYYLKGGVIFLLLDMWIITQTNGAASLDEGMRALFTSYQENPAVGITEDGFIRIVSSATGVQIGERLREWLTSTDELPVAEIIAGLGLEWRPKKNGNGITLGEDIQFKNPADEKWCGMAVADGKYGITISRVLSNSPAEAAGLGVDDELLAIEGVRITTVRQWEVLLRNRKVGEPIRVTAASEGTLYETTITPIQRTVLELVKKENPTAEENARFERWLRRQK